jgi:hypothetical protein
MTKTRSYFGFGFHCKQSRVILANHVARSGGGQRTRRTVEGVVGRKCQDKLERAALVRSIGGSVDAALPLHTHHSECVAITTRRGRQACIGLSTTGATDMPATGSLLICGANGQLHHQAFGVQFSASKPVLVLWAGVWVLRRTLLCADYVPLCDGVRSTFCGNVSCTVRPSGPLSECIPRRKLRCEHRMPRYLTSATKRRRRRRGQQPSFMLQVEENSTTVLL